MNEKLLPLRDLREAQMMRMIRNTCREWMTNNQHEISAAEQQQWWDTFDRAIVRPFLFMAADNHGADTPIGYGLIRFLHNRWWLSGGLWPESRGAGYGKQLFVQLANYVHGLGHVAWLSVFEDNTRARRCYQAIGFVEQEVVVDGTPGARPLIYMVRERP